MYFFIHNIKTTSLRIKSASISVSKDIATPGKTLDRINWSTAIRASPLFSQVIRFTELVGACYSLVKIKTRQVPCNEEHERRGKRKVRERLRFSYEKIEVALKEIWQFASARQPGNHRQAPSANR